MPDSNYHEITDLLNAAQFDVRSVNDALTDIPPQAKEALSDALDSIGRAQASLKEIEKSQEWYNQKSTRFEKINAYISFFPTIVGVLVLGYTIIWAMDAGRERHALRELNRFNQGWVKEVTDSVDGSYKRDSLQFGHFYRFYTGQKHNFDTAQIGILLHPAP